MPKWQRLNTEIEATWMKTNDAIHGDQRLTVFSTLQPNNDIVFTTTQGSFHLEFETLKEILLEHDYVIMKRIRREVDPIVLTDDPLDELVRESERLSLYDKPNKS